MTSIPVLPDHRISVRAVVPALTGIPPGISRILPCGILLLSALFLLFTGLEAHQGTSERPEAVADDSLQELLEEALATHPEIQAARSRVEAAAARIPQAGALPDPTLTAGLMNVPLSTLDVSGDGMTMFALELGQRLPPRGLRRAEEQAAAAELEAARAELEVVEWVVRRRLQEAYFELLLVEEAEGVHHRTHAALEAFATSAETAYTQGLAPQQDILRAQTELASIEEHLAELRQRRSTARAELNALLGRDSRSPLRPVMPHRVVRILEADPGPGLLTSHLVDAELGAGLPTLAELEEGAMERRPELAAARHRARAADSRLEGARRDRRPGVSLMGGYGLRSARSDVVSLGVSVDLPLFRSRKQDQAVVQARHTFQADQLEVEALEREVRREVAAAHAGLIRAREKLILLAEGTIPQARAAVESAAAAYRSGDSSFVGLMEVYAVLFRNEIEYAHLTAELGQELVRLEWAAGAELTTEVPR